MAKARNRNSVLRQLAALQNMNEAELREKWRNLYGKEAPSFRNTFLRKRLAYRIQELFYGGIPADVKEQIDEIAASDPQCIESKKAPAPKASQRSVARRGKVITGTRFIREWKGRQYEVIAKDNGFEFDGRIFRSLSAVATEITGTKWNGKLFFGVTKRAGRRPGESKASQFKKD